MLNKKKTTIIKIDDNNNLNNNCKILTNENLRLQKIINSLRETIKKQELNKEPIKQIKINILEKLILPIKSEEIFRVQFFPNGNFILLSSNLIQIYSLKDKILIQEIMNQHKKIMTALSIKDNNLFITASLDFSIKCWSKNQNNKFICTETISNSHLSLIIKIYIEPLSNNIFSCSFDHTLKIWNKAKNKYQNITTLPQESGICDFLIINEYNYLVSSGNAGTIFYDYITYNIISSFKEIKCHNSECIKLLDYNRVIIGDTNLSIINLIDLKILIQIYNDFNCWCICVLDDFFLTGGKCHNIRIYRKDKYELIQTFEEVHNSDIIGIYKINVEKYQLYSFSTEGTINFYQIETN